MSFLPVRYSLAMFTWLCAASHALACSIILPDYGGFDAQEYVFYGEITGYTRTGGLDCQEGPGKSCGSWGWKLAVLEPVSMPQSGLKEVELYEFGLGADCSTPGWPRAAVEKTPVGTRLMIVAKVRNGVPVSGVPQLDGSGYTGAITLQMPVDADPVRLLREEMDYRFDPRSGTRGWSDFEMRKDMARMEQDAAPEARKRILVRLMPVFGYANYQGQDNDALYLAAVRRYISDEATATWLMAQRREYSYQIGRMEDDKEAVYELERAEAGSAEHQFYYGIRELRASPVKAIPWFKRASRAGFVAADMMLGVLYERMSTEVARAERAKYEQLSRASLRRAALRARQLAQRGDASAQLLLAAKQERLYPWVVRATDQARDAVQCSLRTKVSPRYWQELSARCERPQ